ncbi:hypothetical protein [Teredinibacter turnerae]|uniref:hypothetical protein n=1 Tax=Teredinibacter turnerae TaxID=2426 RepID=UPI00037E3237|nr:hypothetical protein [Teredinibacter turnerae]
MICARCLLVVLLLFVHWAVYASDGSTPLRDPTRPLHFQAPSKGAIKLQLQAIYNRGSHRQAIVNGKLVSEGEIVDGAKITAILENRVRYSAAGSAGTILLRPHISNATP